MTAMPSRGPWSRALLVILIAIASVPVPAAGARHCERAVPWRQCHGPFGARGCGHVCHRRCWRPRPAHQFPPGYRREPRYRRPYYRPRPTPMLVYRPLGQTNSAALFLLACCAVALGFGLAAACARRVANAAGTNGARRSTVKTRILIARLETEGGHASAGPNRLLADDGGRHPRRMRPR